jgi:hypothetical protein
MNERTLFELIHVRTMSDRLPMYLSFWLCAV